MKAKKLLTAIVAMTMVCAASAQEVLKSYSFVEAQGGVQLTSTHAHGGILYWSLLLPFCRTPSPCEWMAVEKRLQEH